LERRVELALQITFGSFVAVAGFQHQAIANINKTLIEKQI